MFEKTPSSIKQLHVSTLRLLFEIRVSAQSYCMGRRDHEGGVMKERAKGLY